MIWQLMRRDRAWRRALWVALGLCAWFVWSELGHHELPRQLSVLPWVAFGLIFPNGVERASPFEAALPISARDLFLARLLSLLTFVCFPVLAIAAACCLGGGPSSSLLLSPVLVSGAAAATAILTLQSFRLQELGGRIGLIRFLAVILPLTWIAVDAFEGPPPFYARPGFALPVCAVAFAALLWRDLAALPQGFQLAPMEAVGERWSIRWISFPMPVWWPLCRSVFDGKWIFPLVAIGTCLASGFWYPAPLFVALSPMGNRDSMRWVWALPVDRRVLFPMLVMPLLLVETAAEVTKPFGLVRAAAVVALTLLCALGFLSMSGPKPARTGGDGLGWGCLLQLDFIFTMFGVILAGPLVAFFVDFSHASGPGSFTRNGYTAELLAAQLSSALPSNPAILIAGSLVVIGALYWLAQREFEVSDLSLLAPTLRKTSSN